MSHPVNFMYKATSIIRPDMPDTIKLAGERCGDCEQLSNNWVTPHQGYVGKSSYGQPYTHCEACESLYVGSLNVLGVERMAVTTPVAAKFGMMSSMALLVEPNRSTLIGTTKVFDKLTPAFTHRRVEATGRKVLLWFLDQTDLTYPLLFITDLGRKKRELINNLRLSTNSSEVSLCDADGYTVIDAELVRNLIMISDDWGNKVKKEFITVMRKFSIGQLQFSDNEMIEFRKKYPEQAALFKQLPRDPHQRLALLKLLA